MQQDLFRVQKRCLRWVGHDFAAVASDKSPQSQCWQRWRSVKYLAMLLLVVSAQWPMMNYIVYYFDDLSLATASLSISLTNVLTAIKISTFLLNQRKFVALMAKFEDMFDKLHEAKAKQGLADANKWATWLVEIYFYSAFCTGLYFLLGPLLKMLWAVMQERPITLELPMPMRFDFDFETSPGYEFAYVYTVFVTQPVVMYASAIDGLFLSFTINLRAHFQALQHFISEHSFRTTAAQNQQYLSGLIQYHVLLLDLSRHVRVLYWPIVFGQFLMTSLQVCLIVYQLVTHMGNVMMLVINCTYLTSIMIQLLIYCYGGEILKAESYWVGIAVQLSNWHNLPPAQRRILCLMLLRSQRVAVIKAGFYEASLANFMTVRFVFADLKRSFHDFYALLYSQILRAAASYITLIQSIE